MDYDALPDGRPLDRSVDQAVKILVTGALGVGKTSLIGAVSEIEPLRSEAVMTQASVGVDDIAHLPGKTTTTVGMDFGRRTLNERLVLYVFGTPGQRRLWELWDSLFNGAVGVLLLVDTRRLDASFEVLDQLEAQHADLPLVVGINRFPDSGYTPRDVAAALELDAGTPVIDLNALRPRSAMGALVRLTEHAVALHPSRRMEMPL